MLFLALFLFFLILSGKLTVEIIAVGIVLSAAVTLFAVKFLGWNKEKDRTVVRQMGSILRYAPSLFVEIIKANLEAIKLILSPKLKIQPVIFRFDSHLKTEVARTVLANSITITPGTITLAVDGEMLTVHALDRSLVFDNEELGFQLDLIAAEGLEEK